MSGQAVFVMWRESMEAILIVGILHSYLKQTSVAAIKSMWLGVLSGLVLSGVLAYTMNEVQSELAGRALLFFEVGIMFLSAILMTQMVFWMRQQGSRMKADLESKLQAAIQKSIRRDVFMIAMFAVAREGSEAVLYLYGISLEKNSEYFAMLGSILTGFALAVTMAWLVSKGLHLLKRGTFFKVSSWILLFSAASLWVEAFGRLIAENVLPGFIEPVWDSSALVRVQSWYGSLLHMFLGYNPRPSLLEVLAYAAFWIGVFMMIQRRFRKTVAKIAVVLLPLSFILFSAKAKAVEYYELEVYGYQLANPREMEIENATSVSSDAQQDISNRIFRSTFEFNYGLNDRLELAGYFDYTKPAEDNIEFTSFRTHARTAFAEKGQLPIDLGAYIEIELPRNYRVKDMGVEFRPILEKDLSRFTLRLNPYVEMAHVAHVVGSNTKMLDADGDDLGGSTASLSDKEWITEYGAAASVSYNWKSHLRPHLDWFGGFNDNSSMLMPSIDFNIGRQLKAQVGVGFGLTQTTEERMIMTRLEYELYF